MVAISYAASATRHNPVAIADQEPPGPSEGRFLGDRTLLSLFRYAGHVVPIDDVLPLSEPLDRNDPYREIRDAINRGLIIAEFGEPSPGCTLREILLRRL